ncbi:MAG: diacylglycerol kinase family lipid kinase [Muribaculaceae bacterium]|nr:diacylglycerol kinase family lipid kinase [Muribaculaceae bacterium]
MKARLVINPISGTRSKEGLDKYVLEQLSPSGWEIDTCFTHGRGDATRLALEAASAGCDAVFAAGGDGTVNEIAAALCGKQTALGIIPCGSGNGLARHLGITIDIREGVKVIAENSPHAIDYATVNDRKFFCTFGVGFDAAVSEAFAEKKKRGKLTYIQSTFETYAHYRPEHYTISAGGHTLTEKAFLVAVCNASQYGNNAYIAPSAVIDDGLLDVTIIHAGNPFSTALVGFDMLTGMIEKNVLIHTFRTSALTISRSGNGPSHLDGEPLQLGSHLDICCHHAALRVIAPRKNIEVKPFITPATAMISDLRVAVQKLLHPGL